MSQGNLLAADICSELFRVETHALRTPVAHALLFFVELGTTGRHVSSKSDPCSVGANLGLGGVVPRSPKLSSLRGRGRVGKGQSASGVCGAYAEGLAASEACTLRKLAYTTHMLRELAAELEAGCRS